MGYWDADGLTKSRQNPRGDDPIAQQIEAARKLPESQRKKAFETLENLIEQMEKGKRRDFLWSVLKRAKAPLKYAKKFGSACVIAGVLLSVATDVSVANDVENEGIPIVLPEIVVKPKDPASSPRARKQVPR